MTKRSSRGDRGDELTEDGERSDPRRKRNWSFLRRVDSARKKKLGAPETFRPETYEPPVKENERHQEPRRNAPLRRPVVRVLRPEPGIERSRPITPAQVRWSPPELAKDEPLQQAPDSRGATEVTPVRAREIAVEREMLRLEMLRRVNKPSDADQTAQERETKRLEKRRFTAESLAKLRPTKNAVSELKVIGPVGENAQQEPVAAADARSDVSPPKIAISQSLSKREKGPKATEQEATEVGFDDRLVGSGESGHDITAIAATVGEPGARAIPHEAAETPTDLATDSMAEQAVDSAGAPGEPVAATEVASLQAQTPSIDAIDDREKGEYEAITEDTDSATPPEQKETSEAVTTKTSEQIEADALAAKAEQDARLTAEREAQKALLASEREPQLEQHREPSPEEIERAAAAARSHEESKAFAEDVGLGSIFRGARATAGIADLDVVEQELKIRARYIKAIEEVELDALPDDAYLFGFVRSYAQYLQAHLEIKPSEVCELFRQELQEKREAAGIAGVAPISAWSASDDLSAVTRVKRANPAMTPKSVAHDTNSVRSAARDMGHRLALVHRQKRAGGDISATDSGAVGSKLTADTVSAAFGRSRKGVNPWALAMVVLVSVIAGYFGWTLLTAEEASSSTERKVVGHIDTLQAPQDVTRPAPVVTDPGGVYAQASMAGRTGITAEPSAAIIAGPSNAAPPLSDTPPIAATTSMQEEKRLPAERLFALIAQAETWARIQASDGSTLFEGVMLGGRVIALDPGKAPFRVRLGNAGGVAIIVDAEAYGPLGPSGRVVTVDVSAEKARSLGKLEELTEQLKNVSE